MLNLPASYNHLYISALFIFLTAGNVDCDEAMLKERRPCSRSENAL